MDIMDIGKAIRDIRKERGFTQIQLAKKIGMAVNSIRLYEAGKRIPSITVRLQIAEALECNFDKLMTNEEENAVSSILSIGYWSREEEFHEEVEFALDELQLRKNDPLYANLISAYHRLNADGQREAVRSVEIIAGNPLYQRTPPAERAETPLKSFEDADKGNTPPAKEKRSEDHSVDSESK